MIYTIETLGCKANLSDSQTLEALLKRQGYRPLAEAGESSEEVSICIINSCTVTDEADRASRKRASVLKKKYPEAKIIITGCGAEVTPVQYQSTPGVDFVIGNQDKPEFVKLLGGALNQPHDAEKGAQILGSVLNYAEMKSRHPIDREWTTDESTFGFALAHARGESSRTRSFLKIQEGCDAFCTYCVIPYGRGPSRGLSLEETWARLSALAQLQVQEVVLTGTALGEVKYLPELFRRLENSELSLQLRLSSLDPAEILDGVLEAVGRSSKVAPHFHVSLQSPLSKILKLMKRKYRTPEVEECLLSIADLRSLRGVRPFVGMDVIVGFPGETDGDFEESVEILKRLPWDRLHVFPYSERQGTPAVKLPGVVPWRERKRRAEVLRSLSMERMEVLSAERLGAWKLKGERALLENSVRGPDGTMDWVSGYTPDYRRVLVRHSGLEGALRNTWQFVGAETLLKEPAKGEVTFLGKLIEGFSTR